jgi:zinc transporter ZupT
MAYTEDELKKELETKEYEYGFYTDIDSETFPVGLNEDVVKAISKKKNEPKWMTDWRLDAFSTWKSMNEPEWSNLQYKKPNFQDISYYSAPKKKPSLKSLDEVDPELLKTFNKLGISLEEQKKLSGVAWRRTTLLTLAITLHNIPEGLAVGVLFGGVAAGIPEASIAGAVVLAFGIGLQNFPEGIAVAMPLRRSGVSKFKSFWYGQLSAIVEPIAGVIGALAVTFFTPLLPYALAFAAGAMIFVVVEEVIPETQQDKYTDIATLGFIGGFIIMMMLDVALG